jgi:hypothetical protein
MCCEDEVSAYPAAIAEMVAVARNRLRSPDTWGADSWGSAIAMRPGHHAGPAADAALEALWANFTDQRGPTAQEVAEAVIGAAPESGVPGLVLLSVSDADPAWTVPELPLVAVGAKVDIAVLVSYTGTTSTHMAIGTDTVRLHDGESAFLEASIEGDQTCIPIWIDGIKMASPELFSRVAGGMINLSAETEVRWSVTDVDHNAHFPHDALRKWDVHGRGYFHSRNSDVTVPPGTYRVRAASGIEFRPFETVITVEAGEQAAITVDLERRIDPHAGGWWSADLHVHANYGGEYAISPDDALRMQRGERLDFRNLVAANQLTEHLHDLSLFRTALDHQLPGSHDAPAHIGIEYRNDLYGHFHVTGARSDVGRYQTGHAQGAINVDIPFNHEAATDFHSVDALVGYCHPVFPVWGDAPDEVLERVMGRTEPRSNEARCAVLDAALGVVDSIDVLSNGDDIASAELYRRMIGAGMRVAATAGSDSMLSLRHLGVHSNPPGWVRCYARTSERISLHSLRQAVRTGRTIATNGPWLELEINGHGPGDILRVDVPTRVMATVRVVTDGFCTVRLFRGSDVAHLWEIPAGAARDGWSGSAPVEISISDALMVEVRGEADPLVLDDFAFAHTSPVYVFLGGAEVRRPKDVEWCLHWLDRLREFVARHGRGVEKRLPELDAQIASASRSLQGRDSQPS